MSEFVLTIILPSISVLVSVLSLIVSVCSSRKVNKNHQIDTLRKMKSIYNMQNNFIQSKLTGQEIMHYIIQEWKTRICDNLRDMKNNCNDEESKRLSSIIQCLDEIPFKNDIFFKYDEFYHKTGEYKSELHKLRKKYSSCIEKAICQYTVGLNKFKIDIKTRINSCGGKKLVLFICQSFDNSKKEIKYGDVFSKLKNECNIWDKPNELIALFQNVIDCIDESLNDI